MEELLKQLGEKVARHEDIDDDFYEEDFQVANTNIH
jgi:hypothetical protein